ncbi:MAG: helix-turn-helix domain-containing protein [Tannerella sp.]|jgi:hypothetical protein|nr:helix-turn-helix domain-containing protein [Tannerella sp.]
MSFIADENNEVFEMATMFVNETSEHLFLTGKAGTGKTTFLRYIREHTHKVAVVAAPTGVAAVNAGGVTLHSLFQLPLEPFVPGFRSQKKPYSFSKAKLDLLRRLELLIIDEVSMLRADILDAIDSTLQKIRRTYKPFGGVQILYIGDMFQLPPVVKDEEWEMLKPYYKSSFFFHSQAFGKTQPVYLALKKVYRQSEQSFIDLLNNVRNNCLTDSDFKALNSRFLPNFTPSAADKYITLTTHNYKADRINRQELDKLSSREYKLSGKVEGDFPEYALPTDLQLSMKEGAQIMFIRNDSEGRYYNGKIAIVSGIFGDRVEVRMPEGDVITVTQDIWKNFRYSLNKETGVMDEEEIGAYTQYPLRLAWAVTIHKSQGLTFEKAIIDIGSSFAPGQAYVALSRCTCLEGIVLKTPVAPDSIMTDPHAIDFSRSEKAIDELRGILEDGKRKFWRERLLLYFDWKPMFTFLWELEKLLEDKVSEEYDAGRGLLETFRKSVREMDEVSGKFSGQLKALLAQEALTGDISAIRERCRKAIVYFHENVTDKILSPLRIYTSKMRQIKRARTFYKHLADLESDVHLFLENMKRVRYNNVPLAEDLEVVSLPQTAVDEPQSVQLSSSYKLKTKKTPGEKAPKIDTRALSLALFNSGLPIKEVAAQRSLAVSTVEEHLSEFLGTEIRIDQLLEKDELAEISGLVRPLLHLEKPAFKEVYERGGGKYSYGKLRMVFRYLKSLNGQ